MLATFFEVYRQAYKGLSPSTWWLSLIMLVNRSGTMVMPFMTIYLTTPEMGYSIGKAGIVMAMFGLGAIAGGYLGGWLTDRFGFLRVQVFSLFGGGLLFIVLGQVSSFPLICGCSFLLSLVNESFRPANATAIAQYSTEQNRTRSYSLNRLAINLGWAVGGALGGLIASYSYELLFWVDGITNISASILLIVLFRGSPKAKQATRKPGTIIGSSAYRDRLYLSFIALTILFAACFFQIFSTLNAYFKNELLFSPRYIGMLMALNGLVITFSEMVIVYRLEGKRKNTYYITLGVLLCGLSYLLLPLFTVGHLMAAVMILGITFGEILAMPFMNSFWISRSSEHNRGQFAGLYTIAWSAAQAFGPFLGSQLAEHSGYTTLWWTTGFVCIATAGGFIYLNNRTSHSHPGPKAAQPVN